VLGTFDIGTQAGEIIKAALNNKKEGHSPKHIATRCTLIARGSTVPQKN